MKETFTEKEFTELLEQENLAIGITRSPKWTMYTRYTIVYKNYSFDDNYELSYPCIMILDTVTLKVRRISNPFSALFLKFRSDSLSDFIKQLRPLTKISNSKCIKVEVPYAIRDDIRDYLESKSADYGIIASRIHGRLDNSSILDLKTEDIQKLRSFESGAQAMKQFTDLQADESLPAPESDMLKFLDEYIVVKE